MKIRLVQAGYQSFSGELGHIQFKDGVSVQDNPNPDFVRSLGALLQIEEVPAEAPPEGGE